MLIETLSDAIFLMSRTNQFAVVLIDKTDHNFNFHSTPRDVYLMIFVTQLGFF